MLFLPATVKFSMLNLTKMYSFVWTCLTVMMLTLAKRKQKFLSGFVHLDSILCKVVVMLSN